MLKLVLVSFIEKRVTALFTLEIRKVPKETGCLKISKGRCKMTSSMDS